MKFSLDWKREHVTEAKWKKEITKNCDKKIIEKTKKKIYLKKKSVILWCGHKTFWIFQTFSTKNNVAVGIK